MAERLRRLSPERLDASQRELYEAIAGGRRSAGPQLFRLLADDGSLAGPFNALLYAPRVGMALAQLGEAIRYGTELSGRIREIAILAVAARHDSAFERYAHERVGRHVGLTEAEITALRERRPPSLVSSEEQAAYNLCWEALEVRSVCDNTYREAVTELGARQIMELVALLGYYEALALLLSIFEVGAPDEDAGR